MNAITKSKVAGAALVFLGTASLLWPALASAQSPTRKFQRSVEARCQTIQTRIDTRIAKFHNNKERNIERYKRMAERLKRIGDKLEAKGYDVTKVRQDYQALNQKIIVMAKDYETFIGKLEATKQYACGQSQGSFTTALRDARLLIKTLQQEGLDIQHYYQTVVRPDTQALRETIKSQTPTVTR